MAVALLAGPLFAAEPAAKELVFNPTAPVNDLKGGLAAQVQFAQSQIVPARALKGTGKPHLIGYRKTLLIVRPLKERGTMGLSVTARDAAGKTLGSLELDPPEKLPRTAYFVEGFRRGRSSSLRRREAMSSSRTGGTWRSSMTPRGRFCSGGCGRTRSWRSRPPTGSG